MTAAVCIVVDVIIWVVCLHWHWDSSTSWSRVLSINWTTVAFTVFTLLMKLLSSGWIHVSIRDAYDDDDNLFMMMYGAQVYTVGLDWGHAKVGKSLWWCVVHRCTLLGCIEATPRHASLYDDVWCTGVHGWAGLRPRRGTQVSGTWRQSGEKQGRQRNPLSRFAIGKREADSTNCLSCIQGRHLAFTFVNFSGFHDVNLVFSAFVCPVFLLLFSF